MHHANNRVEVKFLAFWCLDVKVFNNINQKNKQFIYGQSFTDTPAFTHAKWNHALVFDECGLAVDFLNESFGAFMLLSIAWLVVCCFESVKTTAFQHFTFPPVPHVLTLKRNCERRFYCSMAVRC